MRNSFYSNDQRLTPGEKREKERGSGRWKKREGETERDGEKRVGRAMEEEREGGKERRRERERKREE